MRSVRHRMRDGVGHAGASANAQVQLMARAVREFGRGLVGNVVAGLAYYRPPKASNISIALATVKPG
jgi:hypothetical protein